jgi:hypothetical protein
LQLRVQIHRPGHPRVGEFAGLRHDLHQSGCIELWVLIGSPDSDWGSRDHSGASRARAAPRASEAATLRMVPEGNVAGCQKAVQTASIDATDGLKADIVWRSVPYNVSQGRL